MKKNEKENCFINTEGVNVFFLYVVRVVYIQVYLMDEAFL